MPSDKEQVEDRGRPLHKHCVKLRQESLLRPDSHLYGCAKRSFASEGATKLLVVWEPLVVLCFYREQVNCANDEHEKWEIQEWHDYDTGCLFVRLSHRFLEDFRQRNIVGQKHYPDADWLNQCYIWAEDKTEPDN